MFILNAGQQFIVDKAVEWFNDSDEQVFQYDGPPGSGKSVVLNEIVSKLELDPLKEVAAMSFTGSASLVMRMKGLASAKTAHSWLYIVKERPKLNSKGEVMYDELLDKPIMEPYFIPIDYLPPEIKLIIVDEAYSMPKKLGKNIRKFGIKILACGDQNQLPPVGEPPAFLVEGKIYHLTECMRQLGRRDINVIATNAGYGFEPANGYYGNTLVINGDELSENMLIWADAIICGYNSTRDAINKKVRQMYGFKGDLPQFGEKIVCRRNNWLKSVKYGAGGYDVNLVNGLIGTVCNHPDVSSLKSGLFNIDFAPDLTPGAIFKECRANYAYMNADSEVRNRLKGNKKYAVGDMFEYGYAITAYIAQGSQFHNVLYLEEHMREEKTQRSINLVGASRADTSLIYVKNFDKNAFSNIL